MRFLLIMWLGPISILGIWYGLSYHDINFGTVMFSRELHDLVFELYGKVLGIPPQDIAPLVAKAVAFDSLFVIAFIAYRMRKRWWPTVKALFVAPTVLPSTGQGTLAK